jgi:protein tyrosine phosphatase (PTP) superfamily phosphohydrolase (DUF442 family)
MTLHSPFTQMRMKTCHGSCAWLLRLAWALAYLASMPSAPTPEELRQKRWDVPLDGIATRLRAYASMILVDHGIFRYFYLNLHQFSKSIWRSAQPAPHHIGRLKRLGIRTIVSARGGMQYGSLALEREACAKQGITLLPFVVYSRDLPTREFLLAAPAFFAGLQKPVLFHCKSGADRAGFLAALYLIIVDGRPAAEAKQQLHWRFGHFRFAKTGVLDAFFDMYQTEGEEHGIAFLDWVKEIYDPARIKAGFKEHWLHALLSDGILRRE